MNGDFNNPIKINAGRSADVSLPRTVLEPIPPIVSVSAVKDPDFTWESVPGTNNYKHLQGCTPISPATAAITAILGGLIGLHCFYLGDHTKGVIYLLLSVLGGLLASGGYLLGYIILAIIEITCIVEGIPMLFVPIYKFEHDFVALDLQCYKYQP